MMMYVIKFRSTALEQNLKNTFSVGRGQRSAALFLLAYNQQLYLHKENGCH